ncbi:hypothetical protein EDC01DRAFT_747000 [Geopyxis carbonaria]|nr:hypothetical protein EDC01DRAFT_747000 [Geopyxis carbonaria]
MGRSYEILTEEVIERQNRDNGQSPGNVPRERHHIAEDYKDLDETAVLATPRTMVAVDRNNHSVLQVSSEKSLFVHRREFPILDEMPNSLNRGENRNRASSCPSDMPSRQRPHTQGNLRASLVSNFNHIGSLNNLKADFTKSQARVARSRARFEHWQYKNAVERGYNADLRAYYRHMGGICRTLTEDYWRTSHATINAIAIREQAVQAAEERLQKDRTEFELAKQKESEDVWCLISATHIIQAEYVN